MERKRKAVLPFCCTQALIPQPFSLAFYSLNMVYILRLRNCNFRLHMTLWRVHSGVTPEQLGQSDPHMPSSGEADQTAQQLLLSWPHRPAPHAHHATCCRGSWTTQTKVILHMLVHMFALLYLMHTLTHTHTTARTQVQTVDQTNAHESNTSVLSNSLYWLQLDDQTRANTNCEEMATHFDRQDKWKPFTHSTFFSLLCAIMSTEPWGNSWVCEQIKNQCNNMAH